MMIMKMIIQKERKEIKELKKKVIMKKAIMVIMTMIKRLIMKILNNKGDVDDE